MIVSDEHRYVFIELPRTGTTAVATELKEKYGGRELPGKHSTYRDFLKVATPEQRQYFSIGTIRNPLDVAVSRYVQLKSDKGDRFSDPVKLKQRNTAVERLETRAFKWVHERDADFEAFLKRFYLLPYDTWASLDHKRMDSVLRFESLGADFERTLRQIGIEPVRPLPAVNVTQARDPDFVSYYTPGAIGRAVWVFGPYMKEWGYDFPAEWGPRRIPFWARVLYRLARVVRGVYWRYIRVPRGLKTPKLAPG